MTVQCIHQNAFTILVFWLGLILPLRHVLIALAGCLFFAHIQTKSTINDTQITCSTSQGKKVQESRVKKKLLHKATQTHQACYVGFTPRWRVLCCIAERERVCWGWAGRVRTKKIFHILHVTGKPVCKTLNFFSCPQFCWLKCNRKEVCKNLNSFVRNSVHEYFCPYVFFSFCYAAPVNRNILVCVFMVKTCEGDCKEQKLKRYVETAGNWGLESEWQISGGYETTVERSRADQIDSDLIDDTSWTHRIIILYLNKHHKYPRQCHISLLLLHSP